MIVIILMLLGANLLFALLALKKGSTLPALGTMWLDGVRQSFTVVKVMLAIGAVTALWRASGTIAGAVYYGVRLITPHLFLPVAFLLTSLLSYALGTSFGIVATVGVIFMTLARSGGVDPTVTAGVLFSAVMVGDRGSPVSSSAVTVAELTGTDLFANVRQMLRTGALPYGLCCLVYGLLAVRHPIRGVDPAVLESLAAEFAFSLWIFVPAVLMLALPLFRVPVLHCMGLSALSGALVSRFVQGMDWAELLRCCLFGYTARDASLTHILSGGGIRSMLDTCAVILLACACSGVFQGTHMLARLEKSLARLAGRIGLFPAMILTCLCSSALFCNQIIAIVMGRQLMGPIYERRGESRQQLALDIEDTAITLPALIPWCILNSLPLKLMGADYRSIPYAVFLYAVPLSGLLRAALRRRKNRRL